MLSLVRLIRSIYAHRYVVWLMAFRTIQSRYAGSLGGMTWSVFHPLIMVVVYWFIFSVGFKIRPPGDVPFIVVFLSGLIPWTTFSETLYANATAITAHAPLIKKTLFPSEVLPVVNLLASVVSHIIMVGILILLLLWNQRGISLYSLQFFYYFLALSVLTLSLSWFLSALNVFYRDAEQILRMVLNLWFWLTPIVWQTDMLPKNYLFLIQLNPMYYIVEGYRSSFIYHAPLWEHIPLGIYFWALCLTLFFAGEKLFRKLKGEFADAL